MPTYVSPLQQAQIDLLKDMSLEELGNVDITTTDPDTGESTTQPMSPELLQAEADLAEEIAEDEAADIAAALESGNDNDDSNNNNNDNDDGNYCEDPSVGDEGSGNSDNDGNAEDGSGNEDYDGEGAGEDEGDGAGRNGS